MVSLLMGLALLGQAVQAVQAVDVASVPGWHGPVSKIIKTRCGTCHAPDSVGPFPLLEYDQVKRRAAFIRHVVDEGLMPPWLPTGGVTLRHGRDLPPNERELLLAWLDGGALKGDILEGTLGSSIAEPAEGGDEAVTPAPTIHRASMRGPWDIPAEGGRRWFKAERDKRTFVLPLDNSSPLRVQSIEYRTTAPLALAATALSADRSGSARRMVDWDDEQGSYMMGDIGFVAAGALAVVGPGGGRLDVPQGFHLEVPAMADLVAEVHFRPQGRVWTLDDEILLEEVPADSDSRPLVPLNIMVRKIELDAGQIGVFDSDIVLPTEVDLVALTPRASRRCTSLRIIALKPEATEPMLLLSIADWNPHYRRTYVLDQPLRLPSGTRIDVTWDYDNSEANDRNPVVPPKTSPSEGGSGWRTSCSCAARSILRTARFFASSPRPRCVGGSADFRVCRGTMRRQV